MRRLIISVTAVAMLLVVQAAAPTAAATSVVRCGQGDDLQQAIATARPGDTLVIRGTCVGQFTIRKDLRLKGAGPKATLQGTMAASQPLVRIGPRVKVTIVDLLLTGNSTGGSDARAGGIDNRGRLHLLRSRVDGHSGPGGTAAGGIYNAGTLKLTRSEVADNRAEGPGGVGAEAADGILNTGSLRIFDSRIVGNGYPDTIPSAIRNTGTMRLVGSVVAANIAHWSCGAIDNDGDLTIIDSVLRGNASHEGPGGNLCNSGDMLVEDSVIAEGAGNHGGLSPTGGGVYNVGTATIRRTTVRDNDVYFGVGGGIANVGTLTLADSEVRGNTNVGPVEDGGGIWNGTTLGSREYPGILRIYRTRIHDNETRGSGGGILNEGTLRTHKVRIYRNSATDDGGGIHNTGTVELTKTRMWRNTPNDCTGC